MKAPPPCLQGLVARGGSVTTAHGALPGTGLGGSDSLGTPHMLPAGPAGGAPAFFLFLAATTVGPGDRRLRSL